MIKEYCDICNKELKKIGGRIFIERKVGLCSFGIKSDDFRYELCEECYSKISDFVKNLKEKIKE